MPSTDEKYVVFKKEDFDNMTIALAKPHLDARTGEALNALLEAKVEDATVIRGQDIFAGPALWVYAHSIGVALKTLKKNGVDRDTIAGLQRAADYFQSRAVDADALGFKFPD